MKLLNKIVISGLLLATGINADNVINDDSIIMGSECVGTDCVNGEVFGYSTNILKENNLRILFKDTSSSSSFPTNDWQITINDSANGGENYFAIDNIDSNTRPLKISDSGEVTLGHNNNFVLSSTGDLTIRGTLSDSSDVNLKENINPIKSSQILNKIETLPISTWNYIGNSNLHIGAMAQDFYKAFKYGPDELHISPRDVAFVAVAGVQELVQKINEKDKKIQELQKRVDELESMAQSIKNLETLVGIIMNPKKENSLSLNK